MKAEEVRNMSTDELYHELVRLRRHLFDLRTQAVTEKLEDPTQLGKTKREIARVLTVLNERDEQDIEAKELQLEREVNR
jgi:large subunit ribosomal protein L29